MPRLLIFALALTLTAWGAAAQVVSPLEADEHTLLLYRFEGEGDEVVDEGPLGLNASVSEGQLIRTEGICGRAISLSDHQALVLPQTPEELRGMDQISVEVWFRTTNEDPTHRQRLVLYWEHYLISIFEGGRLTGHLYDQDATKYVLRGTDAIRPHEWYHAALTWDGQRARLWQNGRQVTSLRMTGTINAAVGGGLQIGTVGGDSFIGELDELRISKVARTAFPAARQYDFCHPSTTLAVAPGPARMIFDAVVPQDVTRVECRAELEGGPSGTATIAELEAMEGLGMLEGGAEVVLTVPGAMAGETTFTGTMTYHSGGEQIQARREFTMDVEPMVPPPAEEFRAAWTHSHRIEDPEDIFSRMAAGGLNAAIMRVRRGETAYYNSALGPISKVPFDNEQLLEECAAAAKRHGIDLHLYVNNFPVGSPDSDYAQRLKEQGRWQKNHRGEDVAWLCPSHPENLQLVEDAMVELVRDYDIAGVQYDFIRYGGEDVCFCDRCRANFEERIGHEVENWPEDCRPDGPLYDEWMDFRAGLITQAVRRTSAAVRAEDPDAIITAAVFAMPPEEAKLRVGQDWALWCREGLLDALCPMSYTGDNADYEQTVGLILEAVGEYLPVYAGIGVRASRNRMQYPEQLAAKLNILRRLGAPGFSMFCVTPTTDVPEQILMPLRDTLLPGRGRGEQ
ncbi:MAG: LamG-like jellyroll fold domain-containing protein [Armatimonadota bacterium]|nr:LamG-like jellyroll fold domain-containing protein [Armatimonadota bacterium]